MAKELKIELIVDDKGTATLKSFADGADARLKKIEGAGQSMGSSFAKTWQGMAVGLNQGIQLFQQLAGAVQAPIEAYMEAEKAQLKMGMAMKNQGDFSRAALADMEDYAAQLQRTTAFEDDATLAIMANMKSYGMSNEQVKAATKAALDLATAKANEGMTVEKASEIMGKSYLGISTGLKKLGIQVDETKSKSELFNSVMGQVEDRFGGSAQAELLTYAGQWKQLKNQWMDIQEFLGLTFLKTIEAIQFGISMVGAGFWKTAEMILDGWGRIVGAMASVSKFIGLETIGNGLESISEGLAAGALNAREASAAAIANADANYKNMMSFDKVSGAIDAMGKTGKRTTGQFKEDEKVQRDILKSLTEANKERYEQAISDADHWLKMQKLAGQNELNFTLDTISKKQNALNDWYNAQAEYIKTHISKESQKQAALSALDAKYNSEWEKLANERMAKTVEVIEFEKKARQSYITWDRKVAAEQSAQRRSNYGDLESVCEDTWDAIREYEYMTGKKMTSDQRDFARLTLDEYKDTFFGGIKAGFRDIEKDAMTWGRANTEIVRSMSTSMASSFSTMFEDIYKGKMQSIGDYTGAIWDAVRKKFFDMMATMAAEKVMVYFSTAFSETGTQALSLLMKLVGLTDTGSSIVNDLSGDYSGMSDFYAGGRVNYGAGGAVAGSARYPGDHPGNDTVPAWLSPGEVVIRRTSVNKDTEAILDYINRSGRIPGMYNGGSVAGMVTDQPYRGYWGFDSFLSVMTGGISDIVKGDAPFTQAVDDLKELMVDAGMPKEIVNFLGNDIGTAIGKILKSGDSITDKVANIIDVIADPTASVNTSLGTIGTQLPESLRNIAPQIGATIGTIIYPVAGTAIGYGIGAHLQGQTSDQAIRGAGTAATAAYVSSVVSPYMSGVTGSAVAGKVAGTVAASLVRMGISAVEAGILTDAILSSKVKTTFGGFGNTDFLNTLSDLGGIVGRDYFVSARNGIDYIPRDNFLVNAHEGEAVITKQENKERLSGKGGGINLHFHYNGTVIDSRKAANELAEMLYPRLNKLQAWGH